MRKTGVQNDYIMIPGKINILGISGSLRPTSSAGAILKIVADWVPDYVDFKIFSGLEDIPAFNDSQTTASDSKAFHSANLGSRCSIFLYSRICFWSAWGFEECVGLDRILHSLFR